MGLKLRVTWFLDFFSLVMCPKIIVFSCACIFSALWVLLIIFL
uniref:Uncharacterized protein n=1 Tax=Manihot esculenta TaxID=3983 RepID=A0A2C9UGV4_MANES